MKRLVLLTGLLIAAGMQAEAVDMAAQSATDIVIAPNQESKKNTPKPWREELGYKLRDTKLYWLYQSLLGRFDQLQGFVGQDKGYQKRTLKSLFVTPREFGTVCYFNDPVDGHVYDSVGYYNP